MCQFDAIAQLLFLWAEFGAGVARLAPGVLLPSWLVSRCVTSAAGTSVPRRGPKLEPLLLSADERAVLERWAAQDRPLAARARIVLACAGPGVPPIVSVARDLRVAADTVRTWRRRFVAERLNGLTGEPRPGRRTALGAEQAEAVASAPEAAGDGFSDLGAALRRIAELDAELAIHRRAAELLG